MANCMIEVAEEHNESSSGAAGEGVLCTMASAFTGYGGAQLTPTLPPPPAAHLRLPPLVHSDPVIAVLYVGLMTLALVVGTGGNVLILAVIGAMRNLQRTGKMFIVNLALADLCVALIADPMCVVAVLKGEGWFDDKRWLCETVAALCLTACFCAFLSLTMASLNRYVFICHNTVYDKIFTTKTSLAACVFIWIGAFFLEFPNVVGYGGHYFDPKNHQCIWNRTASLSYTIFVSVVLIFCPLLLMLVCNILIFRHIYRTKYELYYFADTGKGKTGKPSNPLRLRKTWIETLRTSRMLLGIFFVFVVCWTPYGFVIAFDFYQKLSVETHLFVTMLAHLHSSANCIVYAVTNPNFRKSLARRLGPCCCRCSATSASTSGTHSSSGNSSQDHSTLSSSARSLSPDVFTVSPVDEKGCPAGGDGLSLALRITVSDDSCSCCCSSDRRHNPAREPRRKD